jgi:molybdate transport system regulatory protein
MIDEAVSRRDACEALGPPAKRRCALGEDTGISLRIELGSDTLLGPGKAALLSGIRDTGSIAAAGRRMGMSYKRAWYLIDTLNKAFQEPLVSASKGGRSGGGATLTNTGTAILESYLRMERLASEAVAGELDLLASLMKPDS